MIDCHCHVNHLRCLSACKFHFCSKIPAHLKTFVQVCFFHLFLKLPVYSLFQDIQSSSNSGCSLNKKITAVCILRKHPVPIKPVQGLNYSLPKHPLRVWSSSNGFYNQWQSSGAWGGGELECQGFSREAAHYIWFQKG